MFTITGWVMLVVFDELTVRFEVVGAALYLVGV